MPLRQHERTASPSVFRRGGGFSVRSEGITDRVSRPDDGYGGHGHRRAADDQIAQPAEQIRDLVKDQEAQQGGEEDLGVVVDRQFPGGGVGVGRRDGELSPCRRRTGQQEEEKLPAGHGVVAEDEIGGGGRTGEGGEEEHDEGPGHPLLAQPPDHGVGKARAGAPCKAHQGGKELHSLSAGPHDEQAAAEGSEDRHGLKEGDTLPQEEKAEQDSEEGGHLVEHRGVSQDQMVHCVEIAQDAQRTKGGAEEQVPPAACRQMDRAAAAEEEDGGGPHGHQVAEKALLHGGQVSGQPDEEAHQGEEEGG